MTQDNTDFTIHLLGHAHIDLGYRWRWNEAVHRVGRDTFCGVLRMMEEYPELIFIQSQLALYEAIAQHYPDLFAEIKQRVAEGRWIVADGWCEYDQTMPSGEAIIRQYLLGSRYARTHLGCDITLAWAPDAFSGHAHTLPTILKGCGIQYYFYERGVPNNTPTFWWEGPDASRVLAYASPSGYSTVIGPGLLDQVTRWREETPLRDALILYGRGDHGGGPREEDLQVLAGLRATPGAPRFVHTPPERFFQQVLAPRQDLAVYRGELGGGFTGSCSSEGRNKQRGRQTENMLLTAERFATIATYFQRKPCYPRVDFSAAWKTVLRHQFHDELPGTCRAPIYADNLADYDRLDGEIGSLLDTALAEIGGRLHTRGSGTPVVVFNPLSWTRSEPVRVSLRLNLKPAHLVVRDLQDAPLPTQLLSVRPEGHFWQAEVLFLARDVPSLGYQLFGAFPVDEPVAAVEPLSATPFCLENAHLRVQIDAQSGQVASIFDKAAGREVLTGPGALLQAIAEKPGAHSAWIIALTDQVDMLSQPERIELSEAGPVRATVRVSYRYRDSYFVQEIILQAGQPQVDFRLQAEWYERECCLKVAFPLAEEGQATFEAPLGHIVRPADGAEVPAQRWIDLSAETRGASLLNDCRYGFDIRANVMRMTLLRGIPNLDPRGDEGDHKLRYALYPHAGDWRQGQTVRRGHEFNFPLLARQELQRAGMLRPWGGPFVYRALPPTFSFLRLEPANVVLTALKVEEEDWGDGSPLVVRLYETAGQACEATLTLPLPLRFCEETDHVERQIESQAFDYQGQIIHVRLQPYEIKTLRFGLASRFIGQEEAPHHAAEYLGEPPMID